MNVSLTNSCCFIGHRKINETDLLINNLTSLLENLITLKNVKYFLFGSRSEFNNLCLKIVTKLKQKHPNIIRVAYPTKSEAVLLENDEQKLKLFIKKYTHKNNLEIYDEVINFNEKHVAGKSSYIARNKAIINNSKYCIFYYNKNYKVINNANSGTKIAYNYAKKQNKQIFNFF